VGDALTIQQLARYTGEPEERLRDWQARGILGGGPDGVFEPNDVELVRLVQLLLRRGIELEAIAERRRAGFLDWLDKFWFRENFATMYSMAEAAEMVGMDLSTLERFRETMGSWTNEAVVSEEELGLLRGWKIVSDAGVSDDAIAEIVRVYADSLERVAEAEQRLYRFYVYRRLEAQGLSPEELISRAQELTEQLNPIVEPVLLYFHRVGLMKAVREDIVMELAEQTGLAPRAETTADLRMAVVFIDLSSFTPLAEAMGDLAAAQVLERFSGIVRNSTAAWTGRVVKQIGDAFMLVFPEARSAVVCTLEIESRAAKEPQFPAVRAGIHWGTVLYREGDYVGSNVNLASRIANEASRHQILVTADVRKEARDLSEIEFIRVGKRQLKGVSGKLDLFEVHSTLAPAAAKAVDPVCGMELGSGEIAASLSLEGIERAFCSEACLRKFVALPESYGG
jgi:class 3 adenylate cyclase/YHS domain-containing protein